MNIIRSRSECLALQEQGYDSIGFVPTMGALHEGHLSLVRQSKKECALTIVSVFVNPTQFGPSEDFDQYPRSYEADCELLAKEGVDYVFLPDVETIYPNGVDRLLKVSVPHLSTQFCGVSRPHFFDGVCQVVMRLLSLIKPSVLFLGEKDFQQSCVIKQLLQDTESPVQLVVCPIKREVSGLAFSSRNRYLTEEQRKHASKVYQTLKALRLRCEDSLSIEDALSIIHHSLPHSLGFRLDYFAFVTDDCEAVAMSKKASRLLIAVNLDDVRLLDTLSL